MRWPNVGPLLGAPLLLCACAAQTEATPVRDVASVAAEADVRRLERAWLDAYERRDSAAMTTIVADDFTITYPDGTIVDKAGTLRQIGGPPRQGAGPRFRTVEVRARAHRDAVILDGILIIESARAGGPPPRRHRYTDTWLRRNGRWQVVASHLSDLPPG